MHHPEKPSSREAAGKPELRALYDLAFMWAIQHGEYELEPTSVIEGVHDGLPITDQPPRFRFTLNEEKVRSLSPGAAEMLGLDGELEVSYWEPCYSYVDLDSEPKLAYVEPRVSFDIPQSKSKSSHINSKQLTILLNRSDEIEGINESESRKGLKVDPDTSSEERWANLVEAWRKQEHDIKPEECQALKGILVVLTSRAESIG